jgi:hypothetical protein
LSNSQEDTPKFVFAATKDGVTGTYLASLLLTSPFCGFFRSSLNEDQSIRFELVYHLFKDSIGTTIDENDKVYGIRKLMDAEIVEVPGLVDLGEKPTGDIRHEVRTPNFESFFPEDGLASRLELSKLPPVTREEYEAFPEHGGGRKISAVVPRKIIPVPPAVVLFTGLDNPSNLDGILANTCEAFDKLAKMIKDPRQRELFISSAYITVQHLWLHSQDKESLGNDSLFEFLHSGAPFTISNDEWAEWKIDSLVSTVDNTSTDDNQQQPDGSTQPHQPKGSDDSDEEESDDDDYLDDKGDNITNSRLLNRSIKLLNKTIKLQANSTGSGAKQIIADDYYAYSAFLIAGSADAVTKSADLHAPLKLVLQKSQKVACTTMQNILNTRNGCSMLIDLPLARAVHSLQIFRVHPETCGRFSLMFCLPRSVKELTSMMDEFTINARIDAKLLNERLIDSLSESKPDFAFDATTWYLTMKNFHLFVKFLWSENALITKIAHELVQIVENNRVGIDGMATGNRYFIPSYFWLINNRFHNWLDSCKAATTCEDADWDDIMGLPRLLDNLLRNFNNPGIELPATVKAIVNIRYEVLFPSPYKDDRKGRRRVRDRDDEEATDDERDAKRVRFETPPGAEGKIRDPAKYNENVPAHWKHSPAKFRKIISPNATDSPKVGNQAVCLLYHLTGKCSRGRGCQHFHGKLDFKAKEAMDQFVKACKERAD